MVVEALVAVVVVGTAVDEATVGVLVVVQDNECEFVGSATEGKKLQSQYDDY